MSRCPSDVQGDQLISAMPVSSADRLWHAALTLQYIISFWHRLRYLFVNRKFAKSVNSKPKQPRFCLLSPYCVSKGHGLGRVWSRAVSSKVCRRSWQDSYELALEWMSSVRTGFSWTSAAPGVSKPGHPAGNREFPVKLGLLATQ